MYSAVQNNHSLTEKVPQAEIERTDGDNTQRVPHNANSSVTKHGLCQRSDKGCDKAIITAQNLFTSG